MKDFSISVSYLVLLGSSYPITFFVIVYELFLFYMPSSLNVLTYLYFVKVCYCSCAREVIDIFV